MDAVFRIEPALNKEIEIEIEGWVKPVKIKYSTEAFSGVSHLSWQVSGTDHVFRIPVQIVYENHGMDYPSHFTKVLKIFREDFLIWKKEDFKEEWMKKYQRMFTHLIVDT